MHVPKGFALIRVYIKGFRRERFRLGGFWPVQDRVYLANTVQISLTVHNRAKLVFTFEILEAGDARIVNTYSQDLYADGKSIYF